MNFSFLRTFIRGGVGAGITAGISLVLCIFCTGELNAQGGFESVEILQNTTFQFTIESTNSPTITSYPENGSLVRNHLGGSTFRFTYTPDSAFTGLNTFSIEIYSGTPPFWEISYLSYSVQVNPSIVRTRDDALELPNDTADVLIEPLANDSSSIDSLYLKGISLNHGVSVNVTGDFTAMTVTPDSNFTGVAYIQYIARDTIGTTDQGIITILITDSNEEQTDHFAMQTPENTPLEGQLPSTGFSITDQPEYGAVSLDNHAQFTYTPAQGFTGQDSFAFQKGNLLRTVTVEVFEVTQPNTFALDDYIHTAVDQSVTFNVLDNDVTDNFDVSSCNCPTGTIEAESEKGKYTYYPDSGYEGVVHCTYTVSIFGGSTSETADIYIFVGNLSPEGASPYQLVTTKNHPIVLNYRIPLSNFMFSESQSPDYGTLDVYSGVDTLNVGCDEVIGNNLVLYTPSQDFTGMDEFELEYCIDGNGNCDIVKVEVEVLDQTIDSSCVCVDKCVWPGDANDDGRVDMKDLLRTGYHLGIDGSERPNPAPDKWYGQYCAEWDKPWRNNSQNTKYADSDGDGLIEVDDTSAISDFYYNIHSLIPEEDKPPLDYPVELVYTGPPDPEIGDYVTFDLVVGSESYPAENMEGLMFSYDYDTSTVDASTLSWSFKENNWLSRTQPSIEMFKKPWPGRMDAGITRISGLKNTGFGAIATMSFQIIDDVDGIKSKGSLPVDMYIRNAYMMDERGKLFELPEIRKTIEARLPQEDSKDFDQDDVLLFPNPSNQGFAEIRLNGGHRLQSLEVYSTNGRSMHQKDFSTDEQIDRYRLKTGHFSTGLYIIRITTPRGQASKKLQVMNW